jgi:hypothetical protein
MALLQDAGDAFGELGLLLLVEDGVGIELGQVAEDRAHLERRGL